jgi:hypothetical protein
VHRGARGFEAFATDEIEEEPHPPIYIYDRLEEPTRGMLEDHLTLEALPSSLIASTRSGVFRESGADS